MSLFTLRAGTPLAVVVALTLAACGGTTIAPPPPAPTKAATPTPSAAPPRPEIEVASDIFGPGTSSGHGCTDATAADPWKNCALSVRLKLRMVELTLTAAPGFDPLTRTATPINTTAMGVVTHGIRFTAAESGVYKNGLRLIFIVENGATVLDDVECFDGGPPTSIYSPGDTLAVC